MKVCLIYNSAAHYRAGIFRLIDETFDCEWFFGPSYQGIKSLPIDFFKKATLLKRIDLYHPIYWLKREVGLLLSKEYDVFFILGETPNFSVWIGMALHNLFNRNRKVYFWSHGYQRDRGVLRNIFERTFMKLPYASFIYGDYAINYMVKDGFDRTKLFPIHNSLNYEEQVGLRGNFTNIYKNHFANDKPVIFFIGRLTPVKKLHMLIDATEILKKKGTVVNCVFIGDGVVKEELQKITTDKGLKDQVWFYGACYNEKEKSELIANADICVAPGNIGLTAIDSLMYGTPAITMDNFGMQGPEFEAIKVERTGDFFKENDSEDLASKIFAWLNNGLDREQVRKNCYKEVDENWNPKYQIDIIKENLKI